MNGSTRRGRAAFFTLTPYGKLPLAALYYDLSYHGYSMLYN